MHFPNGVQILKGGDGEGGDREVLVVELGRFRVLKVNLDTRYGDRVGVGLLRDFGERGNLAEALWPWGPKGEVRTIRTIHTIHTIHTNTHTIRTIHTNTHTVLTIHTIGCEYGGYEI
jgi:hypothetical protein